MPGAPPEIIRPTVIPMEMGIQWVVAIIQTPADATPVVTRFRARMRHPSTAGWWGNMIYAGIAQRPC